MSSTRKSRIGGVVLWFFFLGLSGLVVAQYINLVGTERSHQEYLASHPSVPGTVVELGRRYTLEIRGTDDRGDASKSYEHLEDFSTSGSFPPAGEGRTDATVTLLRYYPMVSYTVNGRNYEIRGRERNDSAWEIGSTVAVHYNGNDPTEARVAEETFTVRELMENNANILAVVVVLAIWIALRSRRAQRRE